MTQPELVGTDPGHRGRRLAGRLLDELHARCSRDGTALQVIEGIPYFYRRFGYDYALRPGDARDIPAGELVEPPASHHAGILIRPAVPADAPALARVDETVAGRDVLACPRDERAWAHEISGHRPDSTVRRGVMAVLDASGAVAGYLVHGLRLGADGSLPVLAAGCADQGLWPLAVPGMRRWLAAAGAAAASPQRPFTSLRLLLPAAHPLARSASPGVFRRPRAWYARTGDPAALLDHWLPVVARRWREQDLRWPGETMVIDTYRQWITLRFADGVPVSARAEPRGGERRDAATPHAAVPPAALLHLLLGNRGLGEALDLWPDLIVHDPAAEPFLAAGFPAVPPEIWPVA